MTVRHLLGGIDISPWAADFTLPANTKLRVGVASPHAEWGHGGAL